MAQQVASGAFVGRVLESPDDVAAFGALELLGDLLIEPCNSWFIEELVDKRLPSPPLNS
jgi:hypothetical protein